jgi:LAO/AO transport system kinase
VLTVAQDGTGVPELTATIGRHVAFLAGQGLLERRRRRRLGERIEALVEARARTRYHGKVPAARREGILSQVEGRSLTPAEAARILYEEAWPEGPGDEG